MNSRQPENTTDIFRKIPIVHHSPEHIIQAGLGCRLQAVGLIDHATNTQFGSTIDKALLEDLAFCRSRLGLETRRGEPIHLTSERGDYDLRGDQPIEKPTPGPPWKVTEADGRLDIVVTANDIERAKELARHARRAYGVESRPVRGIKAKLVQKYPPPIPLALGLGGPIQFRAVAKCCLNYVAYALGPTVALDPCFDQLRAYVLEGVDNYEALANGAAGAAQGPSLACFDLREKELFKLIKLSFGPVDHRVVIRGCQLTKTAYATVELFGFIPFSILLSADWTQPDFCWGLVIDPQMGGKWRSTDLPHYARPEVDAQFVLDHSLDSKKLKKRLTQLVGKLETISNSRANKALVTAVIEKVLGEPDGRPLTPELVGRLSEELATQVVARELRLDRQIPLPPSALEN